MSQMVEANAIIPRLRGWASHRLRQPDFRGDTICRSSCRRRNCPNRSYHDGRVSSHANKITTFYNSQSIAQAFAHRDPSHFHGRDRRGLAGDQSPCCFPAIRRRRSLSCGKHFRDAGHPTKRRMRLSLRGRSSLSGGCEKQRISTLQRTSQRLPGAAARR